jgi:hypothetical protein
MIHLPPDAPVRALPIAGHDQRVLEPESSQPTWQSTPMR